MVSIVWHSATEADVTFDRDLAAYADATPFAWEGFKDDHAMSYSGSATIAARIVRATFVQGPPTLHADQVSYDPPPFMILSAAGRQALSFSLPVPYP